MIRNIILIYIFTILCIGCHENDRLIYTTKPSVFFPDYVTGKDSVTYSFRMTKEDRDTIYLTAKLVGKSFETRTPIGLKIDKEQTTAQEGIYYEMEDSYWFEPGKGEIEIPIYLIQGGTDIDDDILSIALQLIPTEDIDVAYEDKSRVYVRITNKLVKPSYWEDLLIIYFGEYSQVKHEKCIEVMGHDFPLTMDEIATFPGSYSYFMTQGRTVCYYYATHNEVDENGKKIEVWDPF